MRRMAVRVFGAVLIGANILRMAGCANAQAEMDRKFLERESDKKKDSSPALTSKTKSKSPYSWPAIKYIAIADMCSEPNVVCYFSGVPVRNEDELATIKKLGFVMVPGIAGALTDCFYAWFKGDGMDDESGEEFRVYDTDGNKLSNWVGIRSRNGWVMCTTTLGGKRYPEMCAVELDYGVGEWKRVGKFRADAKGDIEVGDNFVVTSIEADQQGSANVYYKTRDPAAKTMQYRITAICNNGSSSLGEKGGKARFGFAANLENLKEFRVESRPVRMVRYEPVSLRVCEHPAYRPVRFYAKAGDLNEYSVWKRTGNLWGAPDTTPEAAYANWCRARAMPAKPGDWEKKLEHGNVAVVKILGDTAMVEGEVLPRSKGSEPDFRSWTELEFAVFKLQDGKWIFENTSGRQEWDKFGKSKR